MFNTIKQVFFFISISLVLLAGMGYVEVALFLDQISKSSERGEQAALFARNINSLERKFLEIRLLEKTSLFSRNTEIHKNFEVVLAQITKGIEDLNVDPFAAEISTKKVLLSTLVSLYESTFNRLIQLKVEQRLNATHFLSNYQVLNSGIIMTNKSNLLRALFNLIRFQDEYFDSHRITSYQALKMVHLMFKRKYLQSAIDNERLESSINTYSQLLVIDQSLDKEIGRLKTGFDRTSQQLMTIFSELSQKAEKLSNIEIENAASTRMMLLRVFFFSMAIGVILFILIMTVISRRIITPLKQMSNLVWKVKSGNIDARFVSKDKGEIVDLGLAINQMLETIDENNQRWKAHYKNIPMPVYSWRKTKNDFELDDYNDAAFEITEGQIINFIGKKFSEMQSDNPELFDYLTKSYNDKMVIENEMTYRFKSVAKKRVLHTTCVYVPPDTVAVHTLDITERKQAEEELIKHRYHLEELIKERTEKLSKTNQELTDEIAKRIKAENQIKTSLKEKETLLQEIHHRVKNNLAVVSGLLTMQYNSKKNKQLKEALMDSQNRILAMSMIHETLYQSENLSSIDMNIYLSKIARSAFQNYSIRNKIDLKIEAENVTIGVKRSMPLGLIVNELISNSIKYAFPDNQKGEIKISLEKIEDHIEFIFKDNGVGLPKDFDWQNSKSMGLHLIKILGEGQLNGEIELNRDQGTCFIIKFKQTEINT
ncbi:MAG: HAMP domain-containing protein [Deltaproteobacteria bacterium]|jgi:two-component sensor histidine kinase/HAMP domain-containing protein|nr:HAMP domain-containing protein [Deltaproteobacteria bacterium]